MRARELPVAGGAHRPAVVDRAGLLPPEAAAELDRVARVAARALSAPLAVVSLVDAEHRHRVVSRARKEGTLPLQHSRVCEQAFAAAGEVVTVPDTLAGAELAHLPVLVGSPPARSFIGQALVIGEDVVGTFAVVDAKPRRWDDGDLATFVDLAHLAEKVLHTHSSREAAAEPEPHRHAERVVESVADGVIEVDTSGRVSFVNDAASAMLGWSEGALMGQDLHVTTHSWRADGSPRPLEDCPVTDVIATGRSRRRMDDAFWRRDGSMLPVSWSAGALRDGGAVVVFDDISSRRQVEADQSGFTSTVSHELRTPLTSLKGALGLLAHSGALGSLAGEQQLVHLAHRNAERLARLVDDLLDVERTARGVTPPVRREVDLLRLLNAAAGTVAGSAMELQISVHVHAVPATVWGDEHRLEQVLTNLLGNALRFSPPSSRIELSSSIDDDAVLLAVRDEGVGIPADALDRVFDRFWQVDVSDRRTHSGTGLGLTIARNIVEAHGGTIAVQSTVSVGSTFTVRLPLRARSLAVAAERRSHSASGAGAETGP